VSGSIQTTGHRHQEHDHAHRASPDADWRWLAAAGALIVLFMAGEVAAGVVAHSLALLSDAAHMLTDAAAIGLAIVTTKIAGRPARGGYTYGLRRLEILSAQANGITLVILALWLAYEAIRRLITPHPVGGGLMLGVALVGVAVNVAASLLLARANSATERRSLNMEGAVAHVLTDLYAFAATAVAAIIILASGFSRADPIATLVVVALMLRAGSGLIRESGRIFLEAAPADIDPSALGAAMVARPHVAEVHDLHVWAITTGMPAASAHVLVEPRQDCHAVRADLEALLARDYGISHLTLQVDHCSDPASSPVPHDQPRAHDQADPDHGHDAPAPHDNQGTEAAHEHGDHAAHDHAAHDHAAHRDQAAEGDYAAHGDGDHSTHGARDDHDHDHGTRGARDDHDHAAHAPRNRHSPSGDQGPRQPPEAAPAPQHSEEDHAPGLPHCEESHGPAYRPTTHNPGS
jgi:cobalt-zinc-cadmium efflux system protein